MIKLRLDNNQEEPTAEVAAMLRYALVLVSFCASFFVQPTLVIAARPRHAGVVPSPTVTVSTSSKSIAPGWADVLVCAVAAYLPPLARRCSDVGAAVWQRAVEDARAWARTVLDEYRRVMTEVQHLAVPPPRG